MAWSWDNSRSWASGDERHAAVHEGDAVELPPAWARLVRQGATARAEAEQADSAGQYGATAEGEPAAGEQDDAELGAGDSLWQRASERVARVPLPLAEQAPPEIAALWRLFDAFPGSVPAALDGARRDHRGDALLLRLEPLRPHLLRRFVNDVEAILPLRRPRFVAVDEELMVLRGRVEVASLIARAAHRRLPILCAFDDLTGDAIVWQTIRAAVAVSTHHLESHALETALLCDSALGDVSLLPVPALLARSEEAEAAVARQADLRATLRLALAVLRHDSFMAAPSEEINAVGVELKIATSGLWEQIVAESLREAGFEVHERGPERTVSVFSGTSKQIDLVVTSEGLPIVLLDAKYKAIPDRGLQGVAMADAYQLYAYVNRRGCPGLLVYPSRESEAQLVGRTAQALGTHGDQRGDDGHLVGVLSLPFPRPGESAVHLDRPVLESVLTNAGVLSAGPRQR